MFELMHESVLRHDVCTVSSLDKHAQEGSDHALQVAAPHTSSAYAEVTNSMLAAAAAQRRQAYLSNQDQLKQSKKRKMSEN